MLAPMQEQILNDASQLAAGACLPNADWALAWLIACRMGPVGSTQRPDLDDYASVASPAAVDYLAELRVRDMRHCVVSATERWNAADTGSDRGMAVYCAYIGQLQALTNQRFVIALAREASLRSRDELRAVLSAGVQMLHELAVAAEIAGCSAVVPFRVETVIEGLPIDETIRAELAAILPPRSGRPTLFGQGVQRPVRFPFGFHGALAACNDVAASTTGADPTPLEVADRIAQADRSRPLDLT